MSGLNVETAKVKRLKPETQTDLAADSHKALQLLMFIATVVKD